MQSVGNNCLAAERAGYSVLATSIVPRNAWIEGYYDVLASRANALLDHPDSSVRGLAAQTVREIEVFYRSEDSYGYVFYMLRRA